MTMTGTIMCIMQLLVALTLLSIISSPRSNVIIYAYNIGLPGKRTSSFLFQKKKSLFHNNLQKHEQCKACTTNYKQDCVELKMASSQDDDISSSIHDQVLNLHGGKYNFEDSAMAMNAVGREFAQNLYSSSSTTAAEEQNQAEELWPNWAKRMVNTVPSTVTATPYDSTILLQGLPSITMQPQEKSNKNGNKAVVWGASVTIQNQFSTWEPYYSKIIQLTTCSNKDIHDDDDETPTLVVPLCKSNTIDTSPQQAPPSSSPSLLFEIVGSSSSGTLAPQGGSTNLCDANDPYSDSAQIHIRHNDVQQQQPQDSSLSSSPWWCLVVGTEEEQWYYQLLLPPQ